MERGQKTYYRATCQLCTTNVISFCSAYPVLGGIGCPHLYIQRRHNLKVNTKGVRTLPSVSFSDPKRLNNSAPLSLFYSDRWGNGKTILVYFCYFCSSSIVLFLFSSGEKRASKWRRRAYVTVSETGKKEVSGIRCLFFPSCCAVPSCAGRLPFCWKETQFSCR